LREKCTKIVNLKNVSFLKFSIFWKHEPKHLPITKKSIKKELFWGCNTGNLNHAYLLFSTFLKK
jgi:hypothetical protein